MYMSVETAMLKPTGLSNLEPKDVRFITRAIVSTPVLVVNKSSPWNTLREFIDYCKANPGKVTLANAGPGAFTHYACAGLEQAAGITFNYVPFDGGAASATAAMGGHVDAAACVSTEARAGVESGTLKVLASLGEVRSSLYPEVPTLKESGINVGIPGWGCFGVPKNTPDDVVKVLEDAFVKAIQSQGFADMCKTNDWAPSPLSANEAQAFANSQAENFQTLAKTIGVK
jgi:tripartite-type tricarboxylate transporter receptor subunit TctC